MRYLEIDKEKCTGCRICESVCSIAKEGTLNKAKSRIRVMRNNVVKLSRQVCIQCRNPRCAEACSENAIILQDDTVYVDAEACVGCGACTKVCDRLFLSPNSLIVLMCDQCGSCIPHCPEEALMIKKVERKRGS